MLNNPIHEERKDYYKDMKNGKKCRKLMKKSEKSFYKPQWTLG